MALKKLELHQETLKNLTRQPDSRNAGQVTPDITFAVSCPTQCRSCITNCIACS